MIEFDDPEPGEDPDEELAQPERRELPIGPRARRLLTAVATLAVLGAVLVYLQVSRAHQRASVQGSGPTPSPLPATVSPYTPGLLVEHLGDRGGTLRNDVEVTVPARLQTPVCPTATDGLALCAVHSGVPVSVAAAVRARFPHASHATASTAVLRPADALSVPGLWTRRYHARVGSDTLTVLVRRNEMDQDVAPTVVHLADRSVSYVRHVTDRYTVEILYTAGRADAPSSAALGKLAADARLVAS